MTSYALETVREIWPSDPDFESFEVGPDRDGLGCVEVRMKDRKGAIVDRMLFDPGLARMIAKALQECAGEVENE